MISIDTGKVLDVEAISKFCKQCQLHSHLDKDSVEYQLWRADHNHCTANFQGSAPAMEPEGTERIFRHSTETHKLRYSENSMEMVTVKVTSKLKIFIQMMELK